MNKAAGGRLQRQARFRRTPVAAACAALFWAGTGLAQQADPQAPAASPAAQSAPQAASADTEGTLESVVVTGIRSSIEKSIAAKRNSDEITEVITAEDIGKLPDSSIAESIARMPGLTAQRVAGRASQISVRGFSPDFAVTLMNGREQVSTNENRGVEYDQYPSELISGVTVYKTPDATLADQGLSATVDLQTIRPLDMHDRAVVVNARTEKNSLGALNPDSKATGKRFSASYVDQFLDHKLGVVVGIAHLDEPGQEQHFGAWGYDTVANEGYTGVSNPNAYTLEGAEVAAMSRNQKRDGLMASLEYKPDDNFRSAVDLYYSQFDKTETIRYMMWESYPNWGDSTALSNTTVTNQAGGNPMVTSGVLSGVKPILQSNYNKFKDHIAAIGWNNSLKVDEWKFTGDLSLSRATRHDHTLELYAGLANYAAPAVTDSIAFTVPFGGTMPQFVPGLNYADPNIVSLTDPAGWGSDAYERDSSIVDKLSSIKLVAHRALSGAIDSFDVGLNYAQRDKSHDEFDGYYYLNGGPTSSLNPSPDLILAPTSLAFAGIPAVMSYNLPGVLAKYYGQPIMDPSYDTARNYAVSEKVVNLLGKLNIDTQIGAVPVRGNLGLNLVHTNQSSTGIRGAGGANPVGVTDFNYPIESGTAYSNVLPSLNLTFDMHQWSRETLLRFGAARQMARPRMDDLHAGVSASYSPTAPASWGATAGNPKLHPWIADSLDLSAEKYFGKGSYLAAATFYKALKSFIYTQQTPFNFQGLPTNDPCGATNSCFPYGGLASMPQNGNGGVVHGVELSGVLQANLISKALDGFGIDGSVSNTASTINIPATGTATGYATGLAGLSSVVSNVSGFYEKDGVSVRISRRYRSAFRSEALGVHGGLQSTETMAEALVDAQLGYEFQSGMFKGFSVLLQGINLTNAPERTRLVSTVSQGVPGVPNSPEQYNLYGKQYLLGFMYKM